MPINSTSYNVMFLSEQDLKDASLINENVDAKLLYPVIRFCQDIFLTKILGTSLMVDLQNKVYNQANNISGSTMLTSDDTNLLDIYITPLMIWLVMQEAPVFITYKFLNKGVSTQNSDNSQPASDQELQLLANRAKRSADYYTQRLINYILANTAFFPAYSKSVSYDDVIPTTKGYKTSVFLGNNNAFNNPFGWCIDCDWQKYFA